MGSMVTRHRVADAQYEISPYEFGSWSGRVQAFTPTKYLGTNLTAGQAFNETCVTGLDTAVFTSGLSSSAANFCAFRLSSTLQLPGIS